MSAADRVTPERRRFEIWLLWIGFAIVVVVSVLCFISVQSETPFPEAKDIQSMEATFNYAAKDYATVTFQVPRSHWSAILSALLPARKDNDPAKWESLGDLTLKLANGGTFEIAMFSLDREPGAFAAGPTWDQRTYYRGGSSADLEKALADAFEASERDK